MTEFAGNLRERVVLETRLDARDPRVSSIGRYSYVGSVWAALVPLAPAELTRADALSALPRWQVILRKREGVGLNTRITWRGKYLAIRAVIIDPRQPAQMLLTCEEIQ
ncbi:MAG: phage head closure protein [Sphingorhabdus sp.]|uniref:phage head closure protein n=1 Tax=Sphingorhabdus sp. TaxID=1902408 RepID=UPI0038FC7FF3